MLIPKFFIIIINNILNYVKFFVNLNLLIKLDKQFLIYSNIIYFMVKIKKPDYKELDTFIILIKSINAIPKIIFVKNINKGFLIIKYL